VIERILISVLTTLGTRTLTKVLELVNEPDAGTDPQATAARVDGLKSAFEKAFDGKDITPEQRKELNNAIHSFVHGPK
jgi:hypothetical protein